MITKSKRVIFTTTDLREFLSWQEANEHEFELLLKTDDAVSVNVTSGALFGFLKDNTAAIIKILKAGPRKPVERKSKKTKAAPAEGAKV